MELSPELLGEDGVRVSVRVSVRVRERVGVED